MVYENINFFFQRILQENSYDFASDIKIQYYYSVAAGVLKEMSLEYVI